MQVKRKPYQNLKPLAFRCDGPGPLHCFSLSVYSPLLSAVCCECLICLQLFSSLLVKLGLGTHRTKISNKFKFAPKKSGNFEFSGNL